LLPDLCSSGVRPSQSLRDGAGGFLPGVPLSCLGIGEQDSRLRPRPLRQRMRDESRGRVKLVGQPHAGIQRRRRRRRSELSSWTVGQVGRQSPGPRDMRISVGRGSARHRLSRPHTWLANAGDGGAVPGKSHHRRIRRSQFLILATNAAADVCLTAPA
jgi:hypothetical protein